MTKESGPRGGSPGGGPPMNSDLTSCFCIIGGWTLSLFVAFMIMVSGALTGNDCVCAVDIVFVAEVCIDALLVVLVTPADTKNRNKIFTF